MKGLAKELVERLNKLQDCSDREAAHIEADKILCDLLNNLGYTKVVDAYNKIFKYYI